MLDVVLKFVPRSNVRVYNVAIATVIVIFSIGCFFSVVLTLLNYTVVVFSIIINVLIATYTPSSIT